MHIAPQVLHYGLMILGFAVALGGLFVISLAAGAVASKALQTARRLMGRPPK